MNQDSSFPPMLPPSTELGALLFAVLPCLQEAYRPLASFAYHMTELTKLKNIPSIPSLTGISGIEALIADKDIMLRSLSFYGRMFHMPLLSTIAALLQGFQFYQTYKDILPGIFSGMSGAGTAPTSDFGNMAGLFSGLSSLGGFGNTNSSEGSSPDIFSMLGGLPPELLSSLFSGFTGGFSSHETSPTSASPKEPAPASPSADTTNGSPVEAVPASTSDHAETMQVQESGPAHEVIAEPSSPEPEFPPESAPPADDLYNNLYSFLTPEQQKIYEQLMHTD